MSERYFFQDNQPLTPGRVERRRVNLDRMVANTEPGKLPPELDSAIFAVMARKSL
jgi:hypothetical protein